MDLLIVSGSSRVRTAAPLNHRIYADRLGLPYVFDLAPSPVRRIYFHKLDVIRRHLPRAEWLFWIDDDAFFTDPGIDVRSFLPEDGTDLVFCASPINPRGGWTWMSSGQLLIRRTPQMLDLIDAVFTTDLEAVRAWWRPVELGLFTRGDQDAFVYQLIGPDARWRDRFQRLPWEAFNARPYHYESRLDEHFVCHFAVPGGRPKAEVVAEFADRLGTTPALCEPELLEPFREYLERSEIGELLGFPSTQARPAKGDLAPTSGRGPTSGRAPTSRLRRIARGIRRTLLGSRRPGSSGSGQAGADPGRRG